MEHPIPNNTSFRNLTGMKFGKLTAVYYAGKSKRGRDSLWHCVCECGNTAEVISSSLTRGLTKTCWRCPKDRPSEACCTLCKKTLPFTDEFFSKHSAMPFGLRYQCKACLNVYSRSHGRKHRNKDRLATLTHYSGGTPSCACCGEETYEFLCIDHINGGGRKHRAESGTNIQCRLRRSGYPPGFRVLCHNCNMARGFYGYCPHRNLPEDKLVE